MFYDPILYKVDKELKNKLPKYFYIYNSHFKSNKDLSMSYCLDNEYFIITVNLEQLPEITHHNRVSFITTKIIEQIATRKKGLYYIL